MPRQTTYLGDGVHAEFDGEYIILRCGVEDDDVNVIWIGPGVFRSLLTFAQRVGATPATACGGAT